MPATYYSLAVGVGCLGLIAVVLTYRTVLRYPPGNDLMVAIASRIHSGAMLFLRREYVLIAAFATVPFVALFATSATGWISALAYVSGAAASMLAGWIGMMAATQSGSRVCQGAIDGGLGRAQRVATHGGSVMGLAVSSFGLVGLGTIALFELPPGTFNAFALGASTVALFARIGGGIYTKAADIGADLGGKLEVGIPEDDRRNPGVIADNVGDCVGDTAGMGADLFESYVGAIVAATAIAIAMPIQDGSGSRTALPFALAAIGFVCSVAGLSAMRWLGKSSPVSAVRITTYATFAAFVVLGSLATWSLAGSVALVPAVVAGVLCGALIGMECDYFTSSKPMRTIAEAASQGAAQTIVSGLAVGFRSTTLPAITLAAAIGVAHAAGGLYGIAIAAVCMLATTATVMATDASGAIVDNAGGIAETSEAGEDIRSITDELDSLGNTTAAISKGFALGSAGLVSLALFSAFRSLLPPGSESALTLTNPDVIIGLLIGGAVPYLIAALTMASVGKVAQRMLDEIRRQFAEVPGLLEGTAEPDSDRCVDIATRGALREMILPCVVALLAPVAMGLVLGTAALGGFLAGAMVSGILLGILMANGGGAWDNAKKWIELGHHGGKGSDAHSAAIIGDTVGDPFKDTAGPAMNILIKLMAIVALTLAPFLG